VSAAGGRIPRRRRAIAFTEVTISAGTATDRLPCVGIAKWP
jgi:hypothetical protein